MRSRVTRRARSAPAFDRVYRIGLRELRDLRSSAPLAGRPPLWTFAWNVRKIRRFGLTRGDIESGLQNPIPTQGDTEMRNSHWTLGLALAAFVVAPVAAQELAGTLKKIKESGTITIGHRDSSIPFSYYDDKQNVVGYAMDICMKIVDAVKAELKMPNLQVKLNPVTSATRIPLMANGTVDLECGSTTNNLDRQKQVSFTNTHFVTANRYVGKKSSNIKTLTDLKGKTVVSTAGTTNLKWLTEED